MQLVVIALNVLRHGSAEHWKLFTKRVLRGATVAAAAAARGESNRSGEIIQFIILLQTCSLAAQA